LSFASFSSLNSNARIVVENSNTACSKIFRLVSNEKILKYFPTILTGLELVRKDSLVNIDFSDFCSFQTLAFGVQTNLGRALPVYADCLTYPIKKVGSQNYFVLCSLHKFGALLGFYPSFVFDRGFWIPIVMKWMMEKEIIFYLRIKQGQNLTWVDQKISKKRGKNQNQAKPAYQIGTYTKDTVITLFGHKMRLCVSPPPPKQLVKKVGSKKAERWYILTNDFTSSRKEILLIYRCRFEIEETFKDLKHVSDLKRFFVKKKLTFKILLMFACLAFWLSFLCSKFSLLKFTQVHPKKKRSYFRIWWEEIQRSIRKTGLKNTLKALSG
jgi:hypothetical protein